MLPIPHSKKSALHLKMRNTVFPETLEILQNPKRLFPKLDIEKVGQKEYDA
jgi:hypothetical protein